MPETRGRHKAGKNDAFLLVMPDRGLSAAEEKGEQQTSTEAYGQNQPRAESVLLQNASSNQADEDNGGSYNLGLSIRQYWPTRGCPICP
jgi:hypothetical protein